MDDLPLFHDEIAVQCEDTDDLRFTLPRRKTVRNEAMINTYVVNVAEFVSKSCGLYDATNTYQDVTGRPDVRIFDTTDDETKIVGEMKTFWAFPINNNLVDLWTNGSTVIMAHNTSLHQHLIDNDNHVTQRSAGAASCWCSNRSFTLQKKKPLKLFVK
jgi:hypothetical protein